MAVTNHRVGKAPKVLRPRKLTLAQIRIEEWLDFANLLIPPQEGMPTPSTMSADDPVVLKLRELFWRKFEPRTAFRPYTEDEQGELRQRIRAALIPSHPGPRNGQKLEVAVQEVFERELRRGLGEFLCCFRWEGDGKGIPKLGPFVQVEASTLYQVFYQVRIVLQAVSEAVRDEVQESNSYLLLELPMPPVRRITVDKKGRLNARFLGEFSGPSKIDLFYENFMPLLLGGDIDVRLIRVCEVCNRYFYARRKDQLGCNRMHRDVIRARRFRANQCRYEKNRKLNRAVKAKKAEKSWLSSNAKLKGV